MVCRGTTSSFPILDNLLKDLLDDFFFARLQGLNGHVALFLPHHVGQFQKDFEHYQYLHRIVSVSSSLQTALLGLVQSIMEVPGYL